MNKKEKIIVKELFEKLDSTTKEMIRLNNIQKENYKNLTNLINEL